MNRNPLLVLLLLLALSISSAFPADEFNSSEAVPNCTEEQSPWRDFDFWVGEWEVFNPNGEQKYGDNRVEKREHGCLILEQWSSVDGTTGISMNFYDPLTEQWRQVWQSAGIFVDYSGGLDDQGRMHLEGTIFYHANGQQAPFRGRWTENKDGSVLQEFWQFNASSQAWDPWFSGLYVRVHRKTNAMIQDH